jgi:hypothetical protein
VQSDGEQQQQHAYVSQFVQKVARRLSHGEEREAGGQIPDERRYLQIADRKS